MPRNPALGTGPTPAPTRRRWLAALASLGALAAGAVPGPARAGYMVKPWSAQRGAPALDLTDLDGRAWNLATLKGRPVLLNFWATWCEPCRAEMPSLSALVARHKADGLAVLSVNYLEEPVVIRRFLAKMPLTLPILLDPEGLTTAAWTPRVFPTTVLVDRQGVPRNSVVGGLEWDQPEAQELLRPLLARS